MPFLVEQFASVHEEFVIIIIEVILFSSDILILSYDDGIVLIHYEVHCLSWYS